MKIKIEWRPLFWLDLKREDLEPLFVLADHHYDGACKAAARQGGFMYGWRNIVSSRPPEDVEEPVLCSADRRQLDLTLKTCEAVSMAVRAKLLTTEQGARINALCAMILTALEGATRATPEGCEITAPTTRGETLWATSPGRM